MIWLRMLFGFKGRINRLQYWGGGVLMNVLAAVVMGMIGAPLLNAKSEGEVIASLAGLGLVMFPLSIVSLWASLALTVKRLHDRGRTGWISLLLFLPGLVMFATGFSRGLAGAAPDPTSMLPVLGIGLAIGAYFLVDLGLLPGAPGVNRYGPPPGGGTSMSLPVGGDARGSSIDWDASGESVASRLQGAEAAMAAAIEERRKVQIPIAHADRRARAPGLAPTAAPGGFGRRGL
jgi:uncharacterized membrane protein YhaH (DUF805 family)